MADKRSGLGLMKSPALARTPWRLSRETGFTVTHRLAMTARPRQRNS
jgi:hypothetical protein